MLRFLKAIGLLSVLALALSFSACGGSDGVTCASALGHFCDMNCALASNGQTIPRADAIEGCETDTPTIKNCGCKEQFDVALKCFSEVALSQCSSCDVQLGNWVTCMNNCSR